MEMEEGCRKFFKTDDKRLDKIELCMSSKADKTQIDKLPADIIASSETVKGLAKDVDKIADTCSLELIINGQEEINKRQNIIAILLRLRTVT